MAAARSRAPYLPRSPPSSTSSAAAQTDAIDPSTASTPNAQLRFQASLQRELRDAKEELVRAQLENVALASRLRESSSPGASSRRGAESDVTCGTIAGMLSEEDADERRRELLEAIRDERDARGRVEERARALEAELSAKDDKLRAATEMMHEMREALVEAYDGTAHGAGRDAGPAGTTTRGGKSGADDDDDAAAATATAATATAVSPGDMAAGAVKGVVSLVGVLVGTAGFRARLAARPRGAVASVSTVERVVKRSRSSLRSSEHPLGLGSTTRLTNNDDTRARRRSLESNRIGSDRIQSNHFPRVVVLVLGVLLSRNVMDTRRGVQQVFVRDRGARTRTSRRRSVSAATAAAAERPPYRSRGSRRPTTASSFSRTS